MKLGIWKVILHVELLWLIKERCRQTYETEKKIARVTHPEIFSIFVLFLL